MPTVASITLNDINKWMHIYNEALRLAVWFMTSVPGGAGSDWLWSLRRLIDLAPAWIIALCRWALYINCFRRYRRKPQDFRSPYKSDFWPVFFFVRVIGALTPRRPVNLKAISENRNDFASGFSLFTFRFSFSEKLLQSYELFQDRRSDCNEKVGNCNDFYEKRCH